MAKALKSVQLDAGNECAGMNMARTRRFANILLCLAQALASHPKISLPMHPPGSGLGGDAAHPPAPRKCTKSLIKIACEEDTLPPPVAAP